MRPVRAQDNAELHARFERGLRLFRAGERAAALAEFEYLRASRPDATVSFNLALVYASMDRPVEATEVLDALIKDPGRLSTRLQLQVQRKRHELAERIGYLTVNTNVPASIELDGLPRARGQPDGLPVASGLHLLRVLAPGYEPVVRELTIAAGERLALSVQLEPQPPARAYLTVVSGAPTQQTQVRELAAIQSRQLWGWAFSIASIAVTLGGVSVATWSAATLGQLEQQLGAAQLAIVPMSGSDCDPTLAPPRGMGRRKLKHTCLGRIDERRDELEQRQLLRDVGWVTAGVGLAAGTLGLYLLLSGSDRQPEAEPARRTLATRPWLGIGEGGLSVELTL